MPIDLLQDQYLTLNEAAALLPGRPHISTLHRWRTRGVRGIKLRTVLIGGHRHVSIAELHRFIEATTSSDVHRQDNFVPAEQRPEVLEADAILDREGVGF